MDASFKRSFWFDDTLDELGRDAKWVFAWLFSNADEAGFTLLHRRRMSRELHMDWADVEKGLLVLDSPPKPLKGLIHLHEGLVWVRGYIRHNIGNGEARALANNLSKKVRRLVDSQPDTIRAQVLADYPWLTRIDIGRSPCKPSEALLKQASPPKPFEGPERSGAERREGSAQGEREGDVIPGVAWAAVAEVLAHYAEVSGRTCGPGGWIQNPRLRTEVAERIAELDGDVPGVKKAVARRVKSILGGDERWHHLLLPSRLFAGPAFLEAYAQRDDAVAEPIEKNGRGWSAEDV